MEYINLKRKILLSEVMLHFCNEKFYNDNYFSKVCQIDSACINGITFFDKDEYKGKHFLDSTLSILAKKTAEQTLRASFPDARLIFVSDPRMVFIGIIGELKSRNIIGQSSKIPSNPSISSNIECGEGVIIEDGVQIDDGVVLGSGSIIKSGSWIKEDAVIGENSVIGSTGINVHIDQLSGKRYRFPHLAGVIVGKKASLGANCVVVRGTLSSTYIGEEVIIGNLCNIGHCGIIGPRSWISSGVVIGGYCLIGEDTNVGIGAVIKNGISVGFEANIGMGSVVVKNIKEKSAVFGNPSKTMKFIKSGPN